MKLKIPTSDYDAVKDFLSLSAESMRHLLEALKEAKPALLIPNFSDHISQKVGIHIDTTSRIIKMLINLYTNCVKSGTTPSEFVKEFRSAVDKEEKLSPEPQKWETVETVLSEILSLDESLGVTSKAWDVVMEHPRLFQGAHICTDIRPVFKPNPTEPPSIVTVFHTLKINYHDRDTDSRKEFFVALDGNSIEELQEVLLRATRKATSLKQWVKKTEIPFMDIEQ